MTLHLMCIKRFDLRLYICLFSHPPSLEAQRKKKYYSGPEQYFKMPVLCTHVSPYHSSFGSRSLIVRILFCASYATIVWFNVILRIKRSIQQTILISFIHAVIILCIRLITRICSIPFFHFIFCLQTHNIDTFRSCDIHNWKWVIVVVIVKYNGGCCERRREI